MNLILPFKGGGSAGGMYGDLQVHCEISSELYYISALRVGICEMAGLWGLDLPLLLPGISSYSRNLSEIAICHFRGLDLLVDVALNLPPDLPKFVPLLATKCQYLGVDLPVDLPLDLPKLVPLLATRCLYLGGRSAT